MVIPIVVYSDKDPWGAADKWSSFQQEIGGKQILDFQFFVYKPSMLNVRKFLRSRSPVELAMVSLMDFGDKDVLENKLKLLKQLNMLKVTEVEMRDIVRFIEHNNDFDFKENELNLILNLEQKVKEGEEMFYERMQEIVVKDVLKKTRKGG